MAKCPAYQKPEEVCKDVTNFLVKCPAASLTSAGVVEDPVRGKVNMLQIRGKMPIHLRGQVRPIGFRILVPPFYPQSAPLAYVDEPISNEVI